MDLNERRKWLTAYAPLLIWIGVIFVLSSGQGSFSETSRIIRPILEFLFPAASPETLSFYHGIIRKLAHFTEYAVLGWLGCRAFTSRARTYLYTALLVLLVATIDEVNQSFNPARTGSPFDVAIDLSGGIVATGLYYLRQRKVRRRVKPVISANPDAN